MNSNISSILDTLMPPFGVNSSNGFQYVENEELQHLQDIQNGGSTNIHKYTIFFNKNNSILSDTIYDSLLEKSLLPRNQLGGSNTLSLSSNNTTKKSSKNKKTKKQKKDISYLKLRTTKKR